MHKYNIVLEVKNVDQTALEVCLPYHSFIAVSSYKNDELKRLKIEHNPLARSNSLKKKPSLSQSLARQNNSLVALLQQGTPKVNATLNSNDATLPLGKRLNYCPDLGALKGKTCSFIESNTIKL